MNYKFPRVNAQRKAPHFKKKLFVPQSITIVSFLCFHGDHVLDVDVDIRICGRALENVWPDPRRSQLPSGTLHTFCSHNAQQGARFKSRCGHRALIELKMVFL